MTAPNTIKTTVKHEDGVRDITIELVFIDRDEWEVIYGHSPVDDGTAREYDDDYLYDDDESDDHDHAHAAA